jgi:hypothetical protein
MLPIPPGEQINDTFEAAGPSSMGHTPSKELTPSAKKFKNGYEVN